MKTRHLTQNEEGIISGVDPNTTHTHNQSQHFIDFNMFPKNQNPVIKI